MLIAPLSWRDPIHILKRSGKMQLVRVAYCISGIRDGQVGEPQQFGGFGHAVGDQEILGRLSHIFMEDLAEIASVQAAGGRDILHGDIVLEVLLDEGNSLFDVEITQAVSSADLRGGSGTYKTVNKEKEVPDQVEGGLVLMVDDIKHF